MEIIAHAVRITIFSYAMLFKVYMKVYNLHTLCCPEPLYYMQSDNSDKYQFGLRALYFWDHFIHNKIFSERAKRASSVMFVFNRDFRYVRIYIYICGRTSTYMRMLGGT